MCIPPHHPMPSFSINSYYKQSTCIFKLTHQYKYFDWKKGNRVKSICIDFCCIIWLLILFAHVQLKRFVEYVRSYNMPQELFIKLIILFCSLLKKWFKIIQCLLCIRLNLTILLIIRGTPIVGLVLCLSAWLGDKTWWVRLKKFWTRHWAISISMLSYSNFQIHSFLPNST